MALINKVLLKQYNLSADAAYCKIGNVSFDYKQNLVFVLLNIWANKEAKEQGIKFIDIQQLKLPISTVDSMEGETYVSKIYSAIKSSCEDYLEAMDDIDVVVKEQSPVYNPFNI